MGYSNSSLVAYTLLSPNHSGLRTEQIDRISPHCVVGQCTAEGLGDWFHKSSTQASSNYGIDRNGRVGLYVEEKNRSWCTSGNTWSGSVWDGVSIYKKKTQEQKADGSYVTITADFRRYGCVEDSIADHSAYLLGAKNGNKLRYAGLKGCIDYKKAVQIIKDGGYATGLTYVEKLCGIIERWNLTKWDVKNSGASDVMVKYYRVRKSWKDAGSQLGAYTVLDNAKAMADKHEGYTVYDWNGKAVYGAEVTGGSGLAAEFSNADCPFMVKVSIDDLNIRKGAGTNTTKTGRYTGKGVFTIMEVKNGKGSDNGWGKLKSGVGWISLDYCQRV